MAKTPIRTICFLAVGEGASGEKDVRFGWHPLIERDLAIAYLEESLSENEQDARETAQRRN